MAIGATVLSDSVTGYGPILIAIAVAAIIGAILAARVEMTAMPELVAILHSFVGGAVFVGFKLYLDESGEVHGSRTVMLIEIAVDVFLAAITFTGSVLAFLKYAARSAAPRCCCRGVTLINLAMVIGCVVLSVLFCQAEGTSGLNYLLIMSLIASVLGVHLVAAIGGADMPVVVSMLNSYSGWTASRRRLHAGERPLDHHRGAGWLFGRHSVVHHVQGDEPLDRQRHLRWLWHRW